MTTTVMATQETFGEIIHRLLPPDFTLARLQRDADVSYPHLHSLIKGVRDGRIARPSPELVVKLIDVLKVYGAELRSGDEAALMETAANLPDGYRVVRQSQKQAQRLGGDEWEPDVDPDYDPYDTIVEKAGYDTNELDEESKARLRRSIHATVIGLMEQEKREKGQP